MSTKYILDTQFAFTHWLTTTLQELRTEVLSKGVDIEDMERGVRQSIAAVKSQIQRIHT
jgi:hypothetical protein